MTFVYNRFYNKSMNTRFRFLSTLIKPQLTLKSHILKKELRQIEGTIYQTQLLMSNLEKSLKIQQAEREKILDEINSQTNPPRT